MCHRAQILWATSIWKTSMARKYTHLLLCLTRRFLIFYVSLKTHSKDYYPPDAYNQSKLAQVLFTRHLQLQINEDEDCHVQIQAVHPGVVDTDLFQYSSLSYISWFKKLFFKVCYHSHITWWFFENHKLNYYFTRNHTHLQNTEEGARTIVYAAISPRVEGKGGSYLSNCVRVPVNGAAKNKDLRQKFFDFTCKLLDIKEFGRP